MVASLGAGDYAELVSIVAAVSAIDAFCEALMSRCLSQTVGPAMQGKRKLSVILVATCLWSTHGRAQMFQELSAWCHPRMNYL